MSTTSSPSNCHHRRLRLGQAQSESTETQHATGFPPLRVVGDAHHTAEYSSGSSPSPWVTASPRAKGYVREFNAALTPWRREPAVGEFIHHTRKELGVAA
jgi:hypothetical protein